MAAENQGGSMTRFAAILLALSLMASGVLAASPEAAYLAARDKDIAEIKALEDSEASHSTIEAAEDKALADLTKRLKDIVVPVAVKGFPPADTLNLALSEHEEDFGHLDGLASQRADIVVTTRPLLMAWLEQMAKDEDKDRRLPTDVDAAVRQDGFYTFSVGEDAAFAKYADLPVMKPPGADLAAGALGVFTQADGPWPPDAIVVTVIKGDRVFVVASANRMAPVGKIAACEAIWTEAQRKAVKLQAEYRASGLKNQKLLDKSTQAEEQGDRDFLACFNARAPKERFFAGLTKEA
jgi:hypothetical protein